MSTTSDDCDAIDDSTALEESLLSGGSSPLDELALQLRRLSAKAECTSRPEATLERRLRSISLLSGGMFDDEDDAPKDALTPRRSRHGQECHDGAVEIEDDDDDPVALSLALPSPLRSHIETGPSAIPRLRPPPTTPKIPVYNDPPTTKRRDSHHPPTTSVSTTSTSPTLSAPTLLRSPTIPNYSRPSPSRIPQAYPQQTYRTATIRTVRDENAEAADFGGLMWRDLEESRRVWMERNDVSALEGGERGGMGLDVTPPKEGRFERLFE